MQIFGGGDELAKKKDIPNPNLFAISKLQYKYINQWDGSLVNSLEDISIFPIALSKKESFFVFTAIDSPYVPNGVNKVCYYNSDKKFISFTELKSGINLINHEASYMGISLNVKVQGAIPEHQKDWISKNRYKLEFGTVSTPWCPAPEDYAMKSDLDALKAEIDQLKQGK